MHARISNIQKFCIHDGPGIRTTVFFQGCPMKCWWCHNPESIFYNDENAKKYSSEYTVNKLFAEIKKDTVFYDESYGGVTFSGGEPLLQAEFLKEVLILCKTNGINTAIDTTGFSSNKIIEEISKLNNLFLYDLKIIDNKLHEKYTGVSNKIILENLKYLSKKENKINIRIPLIPNITDTEDNIREIIIFLSSLNRKHKINLLPFHKTAAGKYEKYHIENKMKNAKPIPETKIEEIKNEFLINGFEVKVGG